MTDGFKRLLRPPPPPPERERKLPITPPLLFEVAAGSSRRNYEGCAAASAAVRGLPPDLAALSVMELRRVRRELAMLLHPDRGGTGDRMAILNAAIDTELQGRSGG